MRKRLGGEWDVRWDQAQNRPKVIESMISGTSKRLNLDNIEAFARQMFAETADVTGIPLDQMSAFEKGDDGSHVAGGFYQEINGIRVEGTGISVQVQTKQQGWRQPDLVAIGGQYYSNITISTVPKITAEEAVRVAEGERRRTFQAWNPYEAITRFEDLSSYHRKLASDPRLVIVPVGAGGAETAALEFHLTYRIEFLYAKDLLRRC